MDPQPKPLSPRARWMLRIALVVAWGTGVAGTATSGATLLRYRAPLPVKSTPASAPSAAASESAPAAESASAAPSAAPSEAPSAPAKKSPWSISPAEQEAMFEAKSESLERFKRTRVPLAAANVVLSIALVIGAARTIGRRAGGRAWLQQVCFATAVFAAAEYVVSRPERDFLVDHYTAIRSVNVVQPNLTREQIESTTRATFKMSFLLNLLAQVAFYGGLGVALGRRSVGREVEPKTDGRASLPPSSGGE